MTLINGEMFDDGARMTTTDSQQIIWGYCQDKQDVYQEKETTKCPTEDKIIPGKVLKQKMEITSFLGPAGLVY